MSSLNNSSNNNTKNKPFQVKAAGSNSLRQQALPGTIEPKKNAFSALFAGARANPTQNIVLHNQNKRKADNKIKEEANTKRLKEEYDKLNRDNAELQRKTQQQLRGDDQENSTNHSTHIVPRDWLAPEFPFENNNFNDINLSLLMVDAHDKRIGDIPPHLLEITTLPESLQKRTNKPPKKPSGSTEDDLDNMADWHDEMARYKKGPQEYHVQVPVVRMKSICENGCEVLTNVYGVRPRGMIPIPTSWSQEILKSTFPELSILQQNPEYAKYNDGTKFQLPRDRRSEWPKIRQIRNQLIQANPIAKKYCEKLQNALEARLQSDDQERKYPQLRYICGDYTSAMILKVTPLLRESMWGYNHDEQIVVFEVTFSVSKVKQLARKIFKDGFRVLEHQIKLEEDQLINFTLSLEMQFLIDRQLTGMCWYTLPKLQYQIVTGALPEEENYAYRYLQEDSKMDDEKHNLKNPITQKDQFADIDIATIQLEALALAADFQIGNQDTSSTEEIKQTDGDRDMELDDETGEQLQVTRLTDDERAYLELLNANQAQDEDENLQVHRSLRKKTWLRAELHVHANNIVSHDRDSAWEQLPNLRTLAFDIECAGKDGHFPRPGKLDSKTREVIDEGDPIISISCVMQPMVGERQKLVMLWRIPKDPIKHHDNDPNVLHMKGCKVIMCHDERDMLLFFADLIRNTQPSVITGYNIYKFDWKYLLDRAQTLKIDTFSILSPYRECAAIKESIFQSSAMGQQQRCDFICPGLFSYDLLRYVVTELKLKSNTLNYVSQTILQSSKNDVSHHEIPKLFWGTAEERKRLLEYNIKDTDLVLDIMWHPKQQILMRNTEICRVTGVTMDMLITKGQGVKTESQLFRLMARHGFVAPNKSRTALHTENDAADVLDGNGDIDDSFTEPRVSFYSRPIATLDFASLYPSIMIAYNFSYDTILLNPDIDRQRLRPDQVERIDVKDKEGNIEKTFYYVKREVRQGLLCELVEYLLAQRNVVKGLINAATARGENSDLLEARSLALKLASNSAYGFCAAYKLYMKEISECVCAKGRDGLEATQNEIQNHYTPKNGYPQCKTQIVYGDSVTADTPILVRDPSSGLIFYRNISNLHQTKSEWTKFHNDKYENQPFSQNLECWTELGWTKIKRIIKHKNKKEIVRVLTHSGVVDVTTDHSLLTEHGQKITPKGVQIGTKLLHSNLPNPESSALEYCNLTEDEAFVYGLFYATDCRTIKGMKSLFPDINLLESSSASSKLQQFRAKFYDEFKQKQIPVEIINASISIQSAFYNGYCEGGRCDNEGKLGIAGLYYIMNRLGYTVSINTKNNNKPTTIYSLNATRNDATQQIIISNANAIKKIVNLGIQDGDVYDLETENHHFAAGVGKLIVHNTDSVMVDFGVNTVHEANILAQDAEKRCNKLFKAPIRLEFEKIYWPYLLMRKKNYAALKWDPGFWEKSWVMTCESKGPWNPNTNYRVNDAVLFSGATYAALIPIAGNSANEPPKNGREWLCISQNKKSLKFYEAGEYDQNKSYKQWDVVTYQGKTYAASIDMLVLGNNKIGEDDDEKMQDCRQRPDIPRINEETGLLTWIPIKGKKYKPKKDCKGLENKRRDKIRFTQRIVEETLDMILAFKPIEEIIEWIRAENEKLCKGEFDIGEVIQSKSQKISYAHKTQQQTVGENIRRREGNEAAPRPGDRVFFVYIKLAGRDVKSFEQVEDPLYVVMNNIPIDYQKIGESCVINAERRIVHLLIGPDEKDPVKRAELVEKTVAYMVEPFYINYNSTDQAKGGSLMRYVQIQPSCKICNVNLDKFTVRSKRNGYKVLCDEHAGHYDSLLQEYQEKIRQAKCKSEQVWDDCRKCAGSQQNASLCPNKDCSKFWYRIKADNDLKHLEQYVKRIDLSW